MRYLLATWEGGGVIPPELGLAKRLIRRGHSVHVLADPAVEPAARAAGCAFSPWVTAPHRHSLAPEEDLLQDWTFKNPLKLFAKAVDAFICGPADKFAKDTADVLASHPADVVLADMMMLGSMMVAEARRIPCAALIPNIYMRPTAGVPPIGLGFNRARGPIGWLRDALMRTVSMQLWKRGKPAINRARAGLGLAPIDEFWSQYDRADRVFVLTSPSFDFVAPQLPANVQYVGPVLDDPTWAGATWTPPWPASNQDPIVLVGLSSTFQDQLDVLRRVVAALSTLRVRALVTLGPALAPDAVTSPSPNVVIVPTAPHGLVLPRTAVAVTHCGHGTTLRALAAGVPLVCLPMGRDQLDTAARVVAAGAGVRLKPTASADTIRRAVEQVLQDPKYRAGARAMQQRLAQEAAQVDAAAVIEAVGTTSKPQIVDARLRIVDSGSSVPTSS